MAELFPTSRRVRIWTGERLLADTRSALRVVEDFHEVRYYLPLADVDSALLTEPRDVDDWHGRGPATVYTAAGVPDGAWVYGPPRGGRPDLQGRVSFVWEAMDRMFEEDQEVSVHPKNPHIRLDALRSDRDLRIELDGRVLAESRRPVLLAETGHPERWYVPRDDVRWEHLEPTTSATECPYKGLATYWSVKDGPADLVWAYPEPFDPAAGPVADAVCFYAEQVDTYVDGELQPRPEAHGVKPWHLVGDWIRLGRATGEAII